MWLLQQERTRSHRGVGRLLLLVRPDPRRLRNLKELFDRQAPRLRDNYRDSHIRHFHALRGRSGLQQFTQKLLPTPLVSTLCATFFSVTFAKLMGAVGTGESAHRHGLPGLRVCEVRSR